MLEKSSGMLHNRVMIKKNFISLLWHKMSFLLFVKDSKIILKF